MQILDIGEISERTGVPPSTLRYYDEIGLVSSIGRHGLRRQFGPEALLQITLISLGKKAGFSLGEIADMFANSSGKDLPREALHARAAAIDDDIRDLTLLRDMLKHVANCSAPSHLECPRFRKLLKVAGRKAST
ncbi:MAG: helix-turn-helix domain-containing protein [Rhizobiaceae bacterium]|nr:helix-turn-helix domain-containing protein [Rhizobiaceae bacterium]